MMHLIANTATSAAVQELDCLTIPGLISTENILNAYNDRRLPSKNLVELIGIIVGSYRLVFTVSPFSILRSDDGTCQLPLKIINEKLISLIVFLFQKVMAWR